MFKKIIIFSLVCLMLFTSNVFALTREEAKAYVGKYVIVEYNYLFGNGEVIGKVLEIYTATSERDCLRIFTLDKNLKGIAIDFVSYIVEINPYTLEPIK